MDKDKFLEKITELGTITDDAERRVLLAEIGDEVSKVYDEHENSKTTINELNQTIAKDKEDMEKLRQANMSLFLRVGENKSQAEINENTTGVKTETPKEYKSYEEIGKLFI